MFILTYFGLMIHTRKCFFKVYILTKKLMCTLFNLTKINPSRYALMLPKGYYLIVAFSRWNSNNQGPVTFMTVLCNNCRDYQWLVCARILKIIVCHRIENIMLNSLLRSNFNLPECKNNPNYRNNYCSLMLISIAMKKIHEKSTRNFTKKINKWRIQPTVFILYH